MTAMQDSHDARRDRKINKHAKALLGLLADVNPGHEPINVSGFVHELLAMFGMIAAIWSVKAVQTGRPDLSRRWRTSDAKLRSTTHRRCTTTKPTAPAARRTTSKTMLQATISHVGKLFRA